jgi:hypothetical protein
MEIRKAVKELVMEHQSETLESAHDFVKLLAETVAESKRDLESDVQRESIPSRRLDALRIALCNLSKLETHVSQTSRLLNDLRTLRRLLFEERREAKRTTSPSSVRSTVSRDDHSQPAMRRDQSGAAA